MEIMGPVPKTQSEIKKPIVKGGLDQSCTLSTSVPEAVIETDGERGQGLKLKVASLATNSSFSSSQ